MNSITALGKPHHGPHHDSYGLQQMKVLVSSLNSGDLAGAQKAFATIKSSLPKSSPVANDLTPIGKALQSGDVTGAQKAFQTIVDKMQAKPVQFSGTNTKPAEKENDGDGDDGSGATLNISA